MNLSNKYLILKFGTLKSGIFFRYNNDWLYKCNNIFSFNYRTKQRVIIPLFKQVGISQEDAES